MGDDVVSHHVADDDIAARVDVGAHGAREACRHLKHTVFRSACEIHAALFADHASGRTRVA